ncbi:VWA domain-containing protein [Pyxidicoccus fallax]|uniref:VWA domain-containing protein n=1 Tax=Pyxidicoccus fallax TaxID=394095 RepID=A0A848M091_9BACT|nr:VWA domain-containing protein [Pyxidicoccus fallax]NMO22973.1 VWA domain-containing protein [Pyxidicoccus fallax]NPC86888.1 VWA domain-containing protein [Pyxidicoccus fallax]
MNRTVLFLSLAGGLALTALVLGLPPLGTPPKPPPGVVVAPPAPPQPVTATVGSLTMTSRLSHPYIPTGTSEVFATVDLTGAEVPGAKRSPVNLALVIDRSGSMSGYKLAQAKQAARHLVSLLREEDRLAIVHYGSDVKSLPSLPATPGNRERMLQYIDGIWDEGGTNIGAGLSAGRFQLATAQGGYSVNRLILMSDGQPTEGITDDEGLTQQARELRAAGITVSAIGVGTDFNEDLMQSFAEYGAGAYGFLEDAGQLATLFQMDLQQATTSVARDVTLTFTLPPGTSLGEVLGYRASQTGNVVSVTLPDFSAGQLERVVVRLNVTDDEVGRTVRVTDLKLAYTDLIRDVVVRSDTSLSAVVTDRREEVLARQDKEATVYATRARSAVNMQKAAEALRGGRKDEAKMYLQQNQALFHEASAVTGAAAVAADVAEQQATMDEYDSAGSEEESRALIKKSKVKALKSFGRLGSTY